jgi:hypothetical protein
VCLLATRNLRVDCFYRYFRNMLAALRIYDFDGQRAVDFEKILTSESHDESFHLIILQSGNDTNLQISKDPLALSNAHRRI